MDELSIDREPLLSFDVGEDEAGATIVSLSGELDLSTTPALEARIGPLVDGNPARFVVDVRRLRFADSSAIALWVRWSASVGEFELRDPSPLLCRVLVGMGLAERFGVKA